METVIKYRNRKVDLNDLKFIRRLIEDNPTASRRVLSLKLCEAWDWKQENGILCDAICRGLMLKLHREEYIKLPPPRVRFKQPPRRPVFKPLDISQEPICMTLSQLGNIQIKQVRRNPDELVVKSLIYHHHYLGYVHPVGEHLKYLVTAQQRPIACMCWSSAPRHLGPRDRHIGWSMQARKANIRFIAYQSRFLIMPWVHIPHLASHLLGAICRRLSADWHSLYAHPIYFAETFIDPGRYRGTCYKAANWTFLGMTTGRGKDDQTNKPNRSLKQVLGYPLVKQYQQHLCTVVP